MSNISIQWYYNQFHNFGIQYLILKSNIELNLFLELCL